jgi:hypothetical protein
LREEGRENGIHLLKEVTHTATGLWVPPLRGQYYDNRRHNVITGLSD